MSKKQLNIAAISNELEGGASLFFSKSPTASQPTEKLEKTLTKQAEPLNLVEKTPESEIQNKPTISNSEKPSLIISEVREVSHDGSESIVKEINHDVTTSSLHEVNLRELKDIIENTETHNSSLRLTNEENYAVEDMVNELKRSLKVKTSLNEVVRLGLLYIINDFKINREKSLIYKVKKS